MLDREKAKVANAIEEGLEDTIAATVKRGFEKGRVAALAAASEAAVQRGIDSVSRSIDPGRGALGTDEHGNADPRYGGAPAFHTNQPFHTMKPETQAAVRSLVDEVRRQLTGNAGLDRAVDHAFTSTEASVAARESRRPTLSADENRTAPFSATLEEATKILQEAASAIELSITMIEGSSGKADGSAAADAPAATIEGRANRLLDLARRVCGGAYRVRGLLEI